MSSLHDGMNLVAKEFVAARDDERGVLVLSQFTGAARELTEALIVNPYDLEEASAALATALAMPPDEQAERMRAMRALVAEFNVYRWAGRMLVDAARVRQQGRLSGRLSWACDGSTGEVHMKAILSANRGFSTSSAWSNVLLAFDFDGTLAPIVGDRAHASMRARRDALLRAPALLYPCAVDLWARAVGPRRAHRADPARRGRRTHGAEAGFGPLDPSLPERVASWRGELERALLGRDGVEIEDKKFSIAVHYRRARSWRDARRRALCAAAPRLKGAVVFGGHAVVNVLPNDAPTKGDAIRQLCDRLGARAAVYVGDDRTDEEAFRSEVVEIAVRIGGARASSAAYRLPISGNSTIC